MYWLPGSSIRTGGIAEGVADGVADGFLAKIGHVQAGEIGGISGGGGLEDITVLGLLPLTDEIYFRICWAFVGCISCRLDMYEFLHHVFVLWSLEFLFEAGLDDALYEAFDGVEEFSYLTHLSLLFAWEKDG